MKEVEYYQALEKILREFTLHRARLHLQDEGWLTDYPMNTAEIDGLMRELDSARFEEKDAHKARQTGEKTEHPEAELNHLQKQLLDSIEIVPLMMLTPHLRRIEDALK